MVSYSVWTLPQHVFIITRQRWNHAMSQPSNLPQVTLIACGTHDGHLLWAFGKQSLLPVCISRLITTLHCPVPPYTASQTACYFPSEPPILGPCASLCVFFFPCLPRYSHAHIWVPLRWGPGDVLFLRPVKSNPSLTAFHLDSEGSHHSIACIKCECAHASRQVSK